MRSWDWQAGGFFKAVAPLYIGLRQHLVVLSVSGYRESAVIRCRMLCCFPHCSFQLDSSDSVVPSDTTTQRPVWFLISLSYSVQANGHLDSLRLVEVMCAKQLRIPAMFSVSHSTLFGKGCDDTHAHIIVQLITLSCCYFGTKSDADRLLCRMLQ